MAARKRTHNWKRFENRMLRAYFVSEAHKNKMLTAIPVVSVNPFHGNTIHIARCRRHTRYKYGRQKAEVVSV